jgi:hypothetical protein
MIRTRDPSNQAAADLRLIDSAATGIGHLTASAEAKEYTN